MTTVMVIEDEEALGLLLKYNLEKEGYDVVWETTGNKAIASVEKNCPSVILLDWMLQCAKIARLGQLYQRKFIQPLPDVARFASMQERAAVGLQVQVVEVAVTYLGTPLLDGTLCNGTGREGLTLVGQGAASALGLLWCADHRSEIHDGLIVGGGLRRVEQFRGQSGKGAPSLGRINRQFDIEQSAQYAIDVAIDNGRGSIEGHRCNGGSGVFPHPA